VKRLGGTDALFLALETPAWHQHVGGLMVLDPEGRTVDFERIVRELDERLPLAPKFRWKLKNVPLHLDRPVWVDDPNFDIRNHVRRIGVPGPGGPRETAELAGNLLGTQLDRRRPLWELWFLEGLAHGRVAILMKYHHCLLDGISGASLATVLMDLEPEPTTKPDVPPPEQTTAGPEPSDGRLVLEALATAATRPLAAARYAGAGAAKLATMATSFGRNAENRAVLRAPETPFNHPIGPRRSLAFSSVSIGDVRAVKVAHDVKVNDVVLALCGHAFRKYLLAADQLPDQPLVAAVPVSTRADGDTAMDNQISQMFVSLATDVGDPVERLQAVYRSSQSAKEMVSAVGARRIQSLGEVASPLILGLAIRGVYQSQLMTKSPVRVNTIVSNVPGPPFPIYSCGARVTGIYTSSVILEGVGINATVFSYIDRIDFGFHADPDLVPDPWAIAEAIPEALAELMAASDLPAPTPVEGAFGPDEPSLV
jgi:WS/DGAT/MGAT family acyltransferase